MSRRIRMHAIEVLARDYIKFLKKTNNLRKERHFVDKAAKMIGAVLDSPCCDENNAVTFSTPKKNQWIHSFKALLLKVDVTKWKESLQRAMGVLSNAINNECCLDCINNTVTLNITLGLPNTSVSINVSFCGASVNYIGGSPNRIQTIVEGLNNTKTNLTPGIFSTDGSNLIYTGDLCNNCQSAVFSVTVI